MQHLSLGVLAASALPALLLLWAFVQRRNLSKLALACATLLGLSASAQTGQRAALNAFRDDAPAQAAARTSPLAAALLHSRALTLSTATLQSTLATAPLEGRGGAPVVVAIPLPDGSTGRFAVVESPVMTPALAAQFPNIKTYAGIGLDDATASVRFDVTPVGFHAQILSASGTVYIDPVTRTDNQHYLSFFRRDMNRTAGSQVVACGFQPTVAERAAAAQRISASGASTQSRSILSGATLRTYRLAVAATKEYTAFHGGTVAQAQAAIVTSVNRVVGVCEKELAVRFTLVANNSALIYTSSNPGPYTNSSPAALLTQNQANVDAIIGSANYDIGHVFSTGGGGYAGLGVVCDAANKARGETGSQSPVGDAFDIDYVIHEMGHQMGADHTFNNNASGSCDGNRNTNTAYEPGGGSTIMAYAGICGGGNDLQNNSDAYFHTISFQEIQAYLSGTSCAVTAATGNTEPSVTGPAAKTIPANTPFRLTAVGTDADGDALTYNWEEMDLGPAGTPTTAQAAGVTIPLFRSFTATVSPTRYFPRLNELRNGTTVVGERLPTVARTMAFRVTARDQHVGSQGIIGGVTYSGNVTLNVVATTGTFAVTAPNTALTWTTGTNQTVTWNVAGTNSAPISSAVVNIRLSTDGGLTFPTVVATGLPNTGTASVAVPSVNSTQARIMVEAADNYFFDISDVNFTISGPILPTVTGLSPASGPAGSTVTITGTSFTAGTTVSFNGVAVPAANVTVVNGTTITVVIPTGAATGNVTVTTALGTSNGLPFTVTIPAVPTITSLNPTSGYVGNTVTIMGTDFTGATAVRFNGTLATFIIVNNTTITTTVPAGATTGNVTVTTALGTSNGVNFTVLVLVTPTITSLSPVSAIVGTTITITGTDFTGATAVSFNGTAATFTIVNNTTITVTVPAGATTGNVTVTTPLGTSNGVSFAVTVLPVITSLSPSSGGVGSTITINGTNFTGVTSVTFLGQPVAFTYVSPTAITIVVPATASLGVADIYVTTPAGTSNGVNYTVITPVPVITSLSPTSGPVGTLVTITGSGFTGATSVTFSGASAIYTIVNATTITATVPALAFTGNVTVTTPGGASNNVPFTVTVVTPVPVLTSLAPNSGPVGTTVLITGTNLGRTSGVTLNGAAIAFTQTSVATINIVIPAGAATGNVVVITPGGASNGLLFTVTTSSSTRTAAGVFSVYPAPASAGSALQLKLSQAAAKASYTLCNVLGQAISTRSFSGERVAVPTVGLAAGTYLLKVAVQGQVPVTQRIVLE